LDSSEERLAASTKIKNVIRGTLRPLGLDLIWWKPQSSPEAAFSRMLAEHGIDTVLDVGANEGQYARRLRELGFDGRIVSFEPGASAHKRLQQSARRDAFWTVAPREALGNQEGQICLNVASNGGLSSSVLPMLGAHKRAAPDAAYFGSEMVPIARLDRVASELLAQAHNIFLKVDVQGYELEVLQGAAELLPRIVGAQLELSFVPLYEGQALFHPLIDYMLERGFSIWGIMPGLVDNSSGRLLQTDVVFFRW
jgi:FkbM family methyltransferase